MSGSLRSAQLQREDRLCWNLIAHNVIFEKILGKNSALEEIKKSI